MTTALEPRSAPVPLIANISIPVAAIVVVLLMSGVVGGVIMLGLYYLYSRVSIFRR